MALDGTGVGRHPRGGGRGVVDWDNDSDVRAEVRRLVKKALFLIQGGCLELTSRERPRL